MSDDKISDEDERAYNADACVDCGVSPTETERRGFDSGRQWAIDTLRDDGQLAKWTESKRAEMNQQPNTWTPLPREYARWAANYLEADLGESS